MTIAEKIKKYRRLTGMTQADLAEKMNFSLSTIKRLENGKKVPTLSELKELSEILQIPMDELRPNTKIKPFHVVGQEQLQEMIYNRLMDDNKASDVYRAAMTLNRRGNEQVLSFIAGLRMNPDFVKQEENEGE